jgi:hypothetical protein
MTNYYKNNYIRDGESEHSTPNPLILGEPTVSITRFFHNAVFSRNATVAL